MKRYLVLLLALIVVQIPAFAQPKKPKSAAPAAAAVDSSLLSWLQFRNVGPWRGGRSTAVVGHPLDKHVFYFGGTGGGVWKSTDGGNHWNNVSDGFFGGSIGSLALAPSDPTVIYCGGGENTVRGNVSQGNGLWKSLNGGRTWQYCGLPESRHIMKIQVHPKNADLVYCTALGHLYGKNPERGVYRSRDGGQNWQQVLFVADSVGAVDLAMDPGNPDILYATTWNVNRTPWSLESGGPGSGIWKSVDGGDHWTEISRNPGLPKDMLGICGISISPSHPNRLYAIVESLSGGVFRSDNGGATWEKVNEERKLRQRAWYYSKIFCDPQNEQVVYVLNVEFFKSTDGGKTFQGISTPHGDHHDLWIDPKDPQRMIIGDDGGAQVSLDGGKSWTSYHNQPTAQFYRVSTDNAVPYHILGGQQDNSTVRIKHRSTDGSIGHEDFEGTAGGESGYVAADPLNPDIVYGGSYAGYLSRYDHFRKESRIINVWPEDVIGHGAADAKYRFQWNFPLQFSIHDPKKLYAAGNVLFQTTNEGQSWQAISPDLTTNDRSKQQASGGIITKDNTTVEYYCTIFTIAESPLEPGVIWAGTDDGLIHITRDGGQHWTAITPAGLPPFSLVNCLEADPFVKGKAYAAITRYKLDDNRPYIFVTEDYGKSWKQLNRGIPADHFVRVVRADLKRPGLLYAGTEFGLYLSLDGGQNWRRFQNNLPVVPITDMCFKDNDLILATQGRSFWILDDLTPLQQADKFSASKGFHVFPPRDIYRTEGWQEEKPGNAGRNPKPGLVLHFHLPQAPDSSHALSIRILDKSGRVIKNYSSLSDKESEKLTALAGWNSWNWNMRHEPAEKIEGLMLWNGFPGGPLAAPDAYQVRVVFGKDSLSHPFRILRNPHYPSSEAEVQQQLDFLLQVRDRFSDMMRLIRKVRDVRTQTDSYVQKLGKVANEELKSAAKNLTEACRKIDESIHQPKVQANQDMLNYPILLDDKMAALYNVAATGNFKPSQQCLDVFAELDRQLKQFEGDFARLQEGELQVFNRLVREQALPTIVLPEGK